VVVSASHPVASVPMLQMFLAARPIVHVVAVDPASAR
jgi:hypothetical protein